MLPADQLGDEVEAVEVVLCLGRVMGYSQGLAWMLGASGTRCERRRGRGVALKAAGRVCQAVWMIVCALPSRRHLARIAGVLGWSQSACDMRVAGLPRCAVTTSSTVVVGARALRVTCAASV